ncbi:MAG: dual specificity protein phosphatase family protein [Pseudoalteromonas distincta]
MIEVTKRLFVGDQSAYENKVRFADGWSVVHACKEPYHRQALGYLGRGAPKTDPEYLIATRDNRLILNIVDVDNPAYIPKEIMDAALLFIDQSLEAGNQVLVHCNQGMSRSAGIALLFLARQRLIAQSSFIEAEKQFKVLYPPCNMAKGIREFLMQNWDAYIPAK